jgi:glutathione S-transferase
MSTRLYVIPGSHPSMAARLMLDHRGVAYKRTDLLSPMHRAVLRVVGFPGITVPALRSDGQKVQGTGAIARWLDSTKPGPPLVPEDDELRRRVEEAEAWADEDLQAPIRRLAWWAMKRDRSGVASFLQGARLGLPVPILARTAGPFIKAAARANDVTDERCRADMAAFPAAFDRIDGYIADGTIGGETLNVADYQIGTSIRLLMCFEDFRPSLEARPAGQHALRVAPEFPGRVPPVLDDAARTAALGDQQTA